CEGGDGGGGDQAGFTGTFQFGGDEAQAVAGFEFAPCLPAEDRGGVEQGDADHLRALADLQEGVQAGGHGGEDLFGRSGAQHILDFGGDLGFQLFQYRQEEAAFIAVVV